MKKFHILKESKNTKGRCSTFELAHGEIRTPVFMPVGTQATVKSLTPEDLEAIGAQIILGNTYHLYLRPGHALIKDFGGLHNFMGWKHPILTDSGGYQIFSLADLRQKFTEEGVTFQSHLDGGQSHFLSPEIAIEVQESLNSDIMMVLDECTPYPADEQTARKSMELSLRWAKRCLIARKSDNALFGIVQGGTHANLRREYIDRLIEIEAESGKKFDGFSIGGLSVGEPAELMYDMVSVACEKLPLDRPRYLMGVGTPENIVECIDRGVDMFDCVMPTRHARNGALFTKTGSINIFNAAHTNDKTPIDESCTCYTCKKYSRAYMRHLFTAKEMLAARLATIHNLHFYIDLLRQATLALSEDRYPDFKRNFLDNRKEK